GAPVPDTHRAVPAGARQPGPVGAEGDGQRLGAVAGQPRLALTRRRPQAHRVAIAGGGEPPVRPDGYAVDQLVVQVGPGVQAGAGRRVPELDHARLALGQGPFDLHAEVRLAAGEVGTAGQVQAVARAVDGEGVHRA